MLCASCKGDVGASGGAARGTSAQSGSAAPVLPRAGAGGAGSTTVSGVDARDASVVMRPDARVMDATAPDAAGPRPPDPGSLDAGGTPDAAVAPDAQRPTGDPIIVAVGYLGLRATSSDLGRSWGHVEAFDDPGGSLDNPLLLRAVTYGNGLFVAGGHRIFTSPDGIHWTERDNPSDQWFGGVKWGNGRFVASGGYGESWYSLDGLTWKSGGRRSSNSHARSLAFGNGEFRAATDEGVWWSSTDGEAWTRLSDGHDRNVAFCRDDFRDAEECGEAFGHGVYIRGGDWDQNVISWSDDGSSWHNVSVDYTGSLTGIAFGFD